MNDTIISPWVFYFIEASQGLKVFFWLVILLSIAALIAVGYIMFLQLKDLERFRDERNKDAYRNYDVSVFQKYIDETRESFETTKKLFIKVLVLLLMTITMQILVPVKETCYQMLVADQLTYENVNKITEGGKEAIDYFFDKIEQMGQGKEIEE